MNARSSPTPVALVIREMLRADVPLAAAIARVSFPKPWSAAQLESGLRGAGADYRVAEVAGRGEAEVAGYVCAVRVVDELQIHDVAVAPGSRRGGIARALLADVFARAARDGARLVTLEVRPSNRAARTLYRELGFVEVGHRPHLYEDGEDALLMEAPLTRDIEVRNAR